MPPRPRQRSFTAPSRRRKETIIHPHLRKSQIRVCVWRGSRASTDCPFRGLAGLTEGGSLPTSLPAQRREDFSSPPTPPNRIIHKVSPNRVTTRAPTNRT